MDIFGGVILSTTPPPLAAQTQGSGSFSGTRLDLTEPEFCASRPPLPRSPQVEVARVQLPSSLGVRRWASRLGPPSLPPREAGAFQVAMWPTCRLAGGLDRVARRG